jgi:outer membrane murein-binding lipoprotein Lpp
MSGEPYEPIRIIGVDTESVGTPRNDGTRGSALYRVPIKLSRAPSREWAQAFPEAWDHPPAFSTAHRPGIAHVSGDSIILDGATVEEVRDHHASTLKAVVDQLNEAEEQYRRRQQAEADQKTAERAKHHANVRGVADDIKFE